MPWVENQNNEEEYKPSIYTKNELPTWNEIYNEYYWGFHVCGDYVYSDSDPGIIDPYWGISHKKYLIAMVCNQFNKMLLEDVGRKRELIMYLNVNRWGPLSDMDDSNISDIRFIVNRSGILNDEYQSMAKDFPIYTVRHPKGWEDPFITNTSHPRICINDIQGDMMIIPLMNIRRTRLDSSIFEYLAMINPMDSVDSPDFYATEEKPYREIIDWMIKPFRRYFEGASVPGWKDHNGNLIEGTEKKRTDYDPAL